MLSIKNLTKRYKKILAVDNLSLEINKGEIFGFVGPNGAGKSTTIRSIMNLINIDKGKVIIDSKFLVQSDFMKIAPIIGYLPSETFLYDELTVKEMIKYNDAFYSQDTLSKSNKLLKILKLDEKRKIDELSLGNKKKLGIILALAHNPDLIILDEPTSGLDPIMQEKLYDILREEKKNGKTIFYSTHNLSEINKICDSVGIIKEGKLVDTLKISELKQNSLQVFTIISPNINKLENEFKAKIILKNENTLKFITRMEIEKIIKILSKYKIEKVLIEDPNIEDIFMHYYE